MTATDKKLMKSRWHGMIHRCTSPTSHQYADYGGRGIRVCDRWMVFDDFLADMGLPPTAAHSIDRFPDNNGNYEPGNCRWATSKEQAGNRRIARPYIMMIEGTPHLVVKGEETVNEALNENPVREAIQRDRLRDEHNLLEAQMQTVRRGIHDLQVENDRLRKANHEADVIRRVLKWVLAKNIIIARNADQQMFLRDHVAGRPAAIPDVYLRTIFEIVREVELEAEHAG